MNVIKIDPNSKVKKLLLTIKPRQVIYPIIIGLGFVAVMLYFQLKNNTVSFDIINFTYVSIIWLVIAALCMFTRDIGYIIRVRLLSDNELTWRQSFRIIMLWEFTSAVTPSAVGGTSIAVLFVNAEKISLGRSSAIVMATSFLDELYFIVIFPILLLIVSPSILFSIGKTNSVISSDILIFALIGYSLKLTYLLFVGYGLFINPNIIKRFILKIFQLKIIRRWRKKARRAGLDIVNNSREYRQKSFMFWLKTFGATALSWTARYWVVNALFMAFFVVDNKHFLIFSRQFVMWIVMLISPTPGGSGFSEYIFSRYLGDFLPPVAGVAIIMALIWRLYTYYPYLIAGAIIVPRWIKNVFGAK